MSATMPPGGLRRPHLGLVLLAALLVRLPGLPAIFYKPDIDYWKSCLSFADLFGISAIYTMEFPGQPYPPIVLYLLWGIGKIYRGLWPEAGDSPLLTAMVKLPAVAGDLIAAALLALYLRRRERLDADRGLLAAALLAFHPVLFWLSSFWGQVDVLHASFAAIAWGAAWAGAAAWCGVALALGVLTKPQGAIVIPITVSLLFAHRGLRGIGLAAGSAAAVLLLATAPFLASGSAGRLLALYTGAGEQYPYLSVQAFNPWGCLQRLLAVDGQGGLLRDDRPLLLGLSARAIGWPAFLAGTIWLAARSRRVGAGLRRRGGAAPGAARGWRILTLQWLFFFLLPTQVHERYLAPAVLSLTPAVLFEPRLRWIYVGLSLAVLVNLIHVAPGIEPLRSLSWILSGGGCLAAAFLVAVATYLIVLEVRAGRAQR